MEKGAKVLLVILAILCIVMIGFYVFLNQVNKEIPKELEFPESGLSQSIFDSQNTKYTPDAALNGKHYFSRSPYSVDVATTDAAKVSEYGMVYKISDTMYFYMTEFAQGTNVESVIRSELSQAVMIDADASMTAIDNYVYDEGYLNGFKGDYYIDGMTVTNGTRSASVYLVGYTLTITDKTLDHGYKMFTGVMLANSDTQSYASAKSILDTVILTYQYSDAVQQTLVKEEQDAARAEEQRRLEAEKNGTTYIPSQSATQPAQESLVVNTDGSSTDLAASAQSSTPQIGTPGAQQPQQPQAPLADLPTQGTLPNDQIRQDAYLNNTNNNAEGITGGAAGANIPQQKTKVMNLDTEYESVTLYYYYSNTENTVDVSLTSPDGSQSFHPTSQVAGTAVFKLDKMVAGKWHINIQGDAGNDSMKLFSEALQAAGQGGSGDTQQ
ncbi:MAG: hypothetical protein K6E75_06610 [Lachnospiraceae bacterium]|nr:hypothetical protein [Lachnospiraceae bacterium]